MARRPSRSRPETGPVIKSADNPGQLLAEQIVNDRSDVFDKIQDDICDELGIPRNEVLSQVVLNEFPYIKSDFENIFEPATQDLLFLYTNPQSDLSPEEEQRIHNSLVIKIDEFIDRLKEDLNKLKQRRGTAPKVVSVAGGASIVNVDKASKTPTIGHREQVDEIVSRTEALDSYLKQFKEAIYKDKVDKIKELCVQVERIKKLFDGVPDTDKEVARLSRDRYLKRLKEINNDVLKILGELEDMRLSQVATSVSKGAVKSAKAKTGPYVSPWGELSEDIYKPVETEEEKKAKWPNPYAEQTSSLEMEHVPNRETVIPQVGENFVTQVELDWESMYAQLASRLKIPDRIHPDLISFTNDHNDVRALTRELRSAIEAGDLMNQKSLVDKIYALSGKWQNYLAEGNPTDQPISLDSIISEPAATVTTGEPDAAAPDPVSPDTAVASPAPAGLSKHAERYGSEFDTERAKILLEAAKLPTTTPEEKALAYDRAREAWWHLRSANEAAQKHYNEVFARHATQEARANEGRIFNKKINSAELIEAERKRDEARQQYQEMLPTFIAARKADREERVAKSRAAVLDDRDAKLVKKIDPNFEQRVQLTMYGKLIRNPLEAKTKIEQEALAAHPGVLAGLRNRIVSRVTAPFRERLFDENGRVRRGSVAVLGAVGVGSLAIVGLSFPVAAAAAIGASSAGYGVTKLSAALGHWKWVKGPKDRLVQIQTDQQNQILGKVNVAELGRRQTEQFNRIQTLEKRVKWGSRALGAVAAAGVGYGIRTGLGDQISSMFSARANELQPRVPIDSAPRATEVFNEGSLYEAPRQTAVSNIIEVAEAPGTVDAVEPRLEAVDKLDAPPQAERLPHVVEVQKRDNLWTLVQREYVGRGNNFQGLTPGQRDRVLMEIFNEANADPDLKSQIGLEARGGKPQDVHWIYEKQKVDLGPLLERLDEKVRAVREVTNPGPDVPVVEPPGEPLRVRPDEFHRSANDVVPVYVNDDTGIASFSASLPSPDDSLSDVAMAVAAEPPQERASLVPELVPQHDDDMATVMAEAANQDSLLEQDVLAEVANPPARPADASPIESRGEGVEQVRAAGVGLAIEQSQPGSRVFDAAVEAMGGQQRFTEAREALVESIELDKNVGRVSWWQIFTAPSESSVLSRFGDETLSSLTKLRGLPRAAQEEFFAQQGIRKPVFEAWMRGVEGLAEAVTESGVKIDLNKVTLNQLINYATVRGATVSVGA